VNNREKATLIWVGIALAAALMNREIRGSLWNVVKAFASLKIVGPLAAFGGWTVGLAALAHSVGLWGADVRNDTIVWFLAVGMAFFFSLSQATEDGFFRKTARRAVAVTLFVEAFANLEVFGLWVELALLPIVAFLTAMAALSEGKKESAPARQLVNGLLTVVAVCILLYVLVRLARDFDPGHTLRALALPVWLTIGSLPFVYAFALLAEYEQAFLRIDFHTDDPSNRRRAKRALLRAANVLASELGGFSGHWIGELASAPSDADARAVMARWRETWRSQQRASRMSSARAFMREWLTQTDPKLAQLHADTLRRSWERLDREQRETLKAEGLRLAPREAADAVRSLPD
jgi:hypothetical protein